MLKRYSHLTSLSAITIEINSSASIAKFFAASAYHVITTLVFLDPMLAKRALFVFGTSGKFFEQSIVLGSFLGPLILITGLTIMKLAPTRETVSFVTVGTAELIAIFIFLIYKRIRAIRSGTP